MNLNKALPCDVCHGASLWTRKWQTKMVQKIVVSAECTFLVTQKKHGKICHLLQ